MARVKQTARRTKVLGAGLVVIPQLTKDKQIKFVANANFHFFSSQSPPRPNNVVKKTIKTCSVCGGSGHNKRTCAHNKQK